MSVFRCFSRKFPRKIVLQKVQTNLQIRNRISTYEYTIENDPAPIFFKKETQNLLRILTRVDLDKIFRKRKLGEKKLEQPVYKFMTDDQLKEAKEEAQKQADELLQIPPALRIRQPINSVLMKDPALQGLETSRLVITDITFGIKNNDRLIIVREPDGTLQKAEWTLRDRMNQVYFPIKGRTLRTPQMFEESLLKRLLDKKEYEFILDRACLQYEPDDVEYQKITSTTYMHINDNNEFDRLRSTRHFGSLTFFLTWFKKIDNLLLELIETAHMDDARTLVQLYGQVHQVSFDVTAENAVEKYIKEVADKRAPLELALQAYLELEKERSKLNQGVKMAHGLI